MQAISCFLEAAASNTLEEPAKKVLAVSDSRFSSSVAKIVALALAEVIVVVSQLAGRILEAADDYVYAHDFSEYRERTGIQSPVTHFVSMIALGILIYAPVFAASNLNEGLITSQTSGYIWAGIGLLSRTYLVSKEFMGEREESLIPGTLAFIAKKVMLVADTVLCIFYHPVIFDMNFLDHEGGRYIVLMHLVPILLDETFTTGLDNLAAKVRGIKESIQRKLGLIA